MTLEVRKADPLHTYLLDLRFADLQEASEWAPGIDPYAAIRVSIRHATAAFTGFAGDDVVGIWGYRVADNEVHPWLMCSSLIDQHSLAFLKGSRKAIRALVKQYPGKLVCNYVYRDNLQAKRLLTYLGFRWTQAPGSGKFDFFYHPTSCA